MSYMTISSQENHHFSLCSYFHAHPTTLLLKMLGGTNAWAVPPPQILGGTFPPVPPRSPPLVIVLFLMITIIFSTTITIKWLGQKCKCTSIIVHLNFLASSW